MRCLSLSIHICEMGILDLKPKRYACVGACGGGGIRRSNIKFAKTVLHLSFGPVFYPAVESLPPRSTLPTPAWKAGKQGPGSHFPPSPRPQRAGHLKFHTCFLPTRPRIWREGLGPCFPGSLDPRFVLSQQQIPSENHSLVQISIVEGSQEAPRRTQQPAHVVSAAQHLTNAVLQQVPGRVWLRDGQTDR